MTGIEAIALGLVAWVAGKVLGRATGSRASDRVTVQGSVVTGPRGPYTVTADDRLWLGRALIGEVSARASDWEAAETRRGGAAVLWALAANHVLVLGPGGRVPRLGSLAELARAYCQPINPAWADPARGKCLEAPQACTPEKIARRARIRSTSWSELPAGVREVLEAWERGDVPNPVPGATDWHDRHYPGAVAEVAGNWFGVSPGRRLV